MLQITKWDACLEGRSCEETRHYPHLCDTCWKQYKDAQVALASHRVVARCIFSVCLTLVLLPYVLIFIAVSKQCYGTLPPPTGMGSGCACVERQTHMGPNCTMNVTVCASASHREVCSCPWAQEVGPSCLKSLSAWVKSDEDRPDSWWGWVTSRWREG